MLPIPEAISASIAPWKKNGLAKAARAEPMGSSTSLTRPWPSASLRARNASTVRSLCDVETKSCPYRGSPEKVTFFTVKFRCRSASGKAADRAASRELTTTSSVAGSASPKLRAVKTPGLALAREAKSAPIFSASSRPRPSRWSSRMSWDRRTPMPFFMYAVPPYDRETLSTIFSLLAFPPGWNTWASTVW